MERRAKSGKQTVLKSVNIKPQILSADLSLEGDVICLRALLSADPAAYLNPEHLVSVLKRECGILREENLVKESYSILRTQAYCKDLTPFR